MRTVRRIKTVRHKLEKPSVPFLSELAVRRASFFLLGEKKREDEEEEEEPPQKRGEFSRGNFGAGTLQRGRGIVGGPGRGRR